MDQRFFSLLFILNVGSVDFTGDEVLGSFIILDFTNHGVYVAFI